MSRSRLVALLAVGALLVLGLPTSAFAGSNSAGTTLVQNTPQTLTVRCPGGQVATGGGFRASPPDQPDIFTTNVFVAISESHKVGQRHWRVSAVEVGPNPASLTAYVYCRADGAKTKQVSSGPTSGVGDAPCQGGKTVQSGGFQISSDFPALGDSFRAPRQAWRVRERAGSTMRAFADCADADAPHMRAGIASSTGGAVTAQSRECRDGKPLSGGWIQPNGSGFFAYSIYESFRSGKRWLTSGHFNPSFFGPSSTPIELKSVAYCS